MCIPSCNTVPNKGQPKCLQQAASCPQIACYPLGKACQPLQFVHTTTWLKYSLIPTPVCSNTIPYCSNTILTVKFNCVDMALCLLCSRSLTHIHTCVQTPLQNAPAICQLHNCRCYTHSVIHLPAHSLAIMYILHQILYTLQHQLDNICTSVLMYPKLLHCLPDADCATYCCT
jgi:hypothetical protein